MAWVAVNWNDDEYIYEKMPERFYHRWMTAICEYELGELTNFEETEDVE